VTGDEAATVVTVYATTSLANYLELPCHATVACTRRSDSGVRAKNIASKRAGKTRGDWGRGQFPVSPRLFPLFARYVFAHAPLSERLEQAMQSSTFEDIWHKTGQELVQH